MKRICVFCGSSRGSDAVFADAARDLGGLLAARGFGLVYGGGNVGLMGVIADAAIGNGGEVIGVIPQALVDKELAHLGLNELHIVQSMHERKAMMAELSDGFIALPGGYGTLEEFCEILTWSQLGLHGKPFGLLNVGGFYDSFIAHVENAVRLRFIRPEHREMLLEASEASALLDALKQYRPPAAHKWIDRDET